MCGFIESGKNQWRTDSISSPDVRAVGNTVRRRRGTQNRNNLCQRSSSVSFPLHKTLRKTSVLFGSRKFQSSAMTHMVKVAACTTVLRWRPHNWHHYVSSYRIIAWTKNRKSDVQSSLRRKKGFIWFTDIPIWRDAQDSKTFDWMMPYSVRGNFLKIGKHDFWNATRLKRR